MPSFIGGLEKSFNRQFDNVEGGGFGDQAQDFFIQTERRADDDFIVTGTPKKIHDTFIDYDSNPNYADWQKDTVDLPGPSAWGEPNSVANNPSKAVKKTLDDGYVWAKGDWQFTNDGDEPVNDPQQGGQWLAYALVAGVVLFLLAPLLNAFTAVTEATT